jgi:TonB family protein
MRMVAPLFVVIIFASLPYSITTQDPTPPTSSTQSSSPGHHDLTRWRLVRKVNPEYPKKARKQHVEGTVRLHAIIDKDGSVRDLEVISGDPLLTDAAVKAVRQWRYSPTLLDGQAKEITTTIEVVFALNKNP